MATTITITKEAIKEITVLDLKPGTYFTFKHHDHQYLHNPVGYLKLENTYVDLSNKKVGSILTEEWLKNSPVVEFEAHLSLTPIIR